MMNNVQMTLWNIEVTSKNSEVIKITDFGEKIGGARKDRWADKRLCRDDLLTLSDREADKFVTKDNIWPKLNYETMVENGIQAYVVYLVKKIRDSLPAKIKPTASEERNKANREKYIELIEITRDVLEEVKSEEDLKGLFDKILVVNGYYDRDKRKWTEKAMGNPSLQNKFVKTIQITDWDIIKAKRDVERTGFPKKTDAWQKNIEIKETKEGWVIHKKINRFGMYIQLSDEVFDTKEKAEKYLLDKLKPQMQKKKTDEPVIPQLAHIERIGKDYRSGNVTGNDLIEAFGFRGGEFGNWATQKERQANLNYAYDALMDLADVLSIKPKHISLDGQLGIAFGARGSGGRNAALAHYEPSKIVINLTKMKGAGSLAHEWWHALDDYLGRLSGDRNASSPYLSTGYSHNSKLPKEVLSAFSLLKETLLYASKSKEEVIKDIRTDLEKRRNTLDYFLKPIIDKLENETYASRYDRKSKKYENVAIRKATEDELSLAYELISSLKDGIKIEESVESLSNLQKRVKDRVIDKKTRDNLILYARILSSYKEQLEKAENGEVFSKKESNYLKNAKDIDRMLGRKKLYWSSIEELMARAFAAYVEDRLPAKSQYLVHSTKNDKYKLKPYPEGEERVKINKAFDNLFTRINKNIFLISV